MFVQNVCQCNHHFFQEAFCNYFTFSISDFLAKVALWTNSKLGALRPVIIAILISGNSISQHWFGESEQGDNRLLSVLLTLPFSKLLSRSMTPPFSQAPSIICQFFQSIPSSNWRLRNATGISTFGIFCSTLISNRLDPCPTSRDPIELRFDCTRRPCLQKSQYKFSGG